MVKKALLAWYVEADKDGEPVGIIVTARTERGARMGAHRNAGPLEHIYSVALIDYPFAWVLHS